MSRSYGHSASSAPLQTGGQSSVLGHLSDAMVRALELPLLWLQRDRDRRTLLSLDDRLLRDIGVDRAQVAEEAEKPFWRA